MSRVEPTENRRHQERRQAEERRRQPVDRTPGKAEGEESDVDQALENQEQRQS